MEFGEYLNKLRVAKGFKTLRSFDRAVGISYTHLHNIESGNRNIPSPEIIRKLSTALGVTHIGMMIMAGHVTEEEVMTYRRECGISD